MDSILSKEPASEFLAVMVLFRVLTERFNRFGFGFFKKLILSNIREVEESSLRGSSGDPIQCGLREQKWLPFTIRSLRRLPNPLFLGASNGVPNLLFDLEKRTGFSS